MTRDLWLEAHAYLRPLADLSALVDRAADGVAVLAAPIPDWDEYRPDFLAGVPLLSSAAAMRPPGSRSTPASALVSSGTPARKSAR